MKPMFLFALLLTSATSFAQGGGSVNGPDLKGQMIPVFSDGEIEASKLNSSLNFCYKRLATQIFEQIIGRPAVLNGGTFGDQSVDVTHRDRTSTDGNGVYPRVNFYTDGEHSRDLVIRSTDSIRMRPKYDFSSYELSLTQTPGVGPDGRSNSSLLNLKYSVFSSSGMNLVDQNSISLSAASFPYLLFELKDKSIYGELGELIETKYFVSNLRFVSQGGQRNFTLYTVHKDNTVVNTKIVVDSLDLINCVKTKLSN